MGNWANSRLKNLSDTDKTRDNSKVGSGFGKNISNWLDRDKAYEAVRQFNKRKIIFEKTVTFHQLLL